MLTKFQVLVNQKQFRYMYLLLNVHVRLYFDEVSCLSFLILRVHSFSQWLLNLYLILVFFQYCLFSCFRPIIIWNTGLLYSTGKFNHVRIFMFQSWQFSLCYFYRDMRQLPSSRYMLVIGRMAKNDTDNIIGVYDFLKELFVRKRKLVIYKFKILFEQKCPIQLLSGFQSLCMCNTLIFYSTKLHYQEQNKTYWEDIWVKSATEGFRKCSFKENMSIIVKTEMYLKILSDIKRYIEWKDISKLSLLVFMLNIWTA